MSNDWRYPILMLHKQMPLEVIKSPSETYTFLAAHPISFLGEHFIDPVSNLWKIGGIRVLGGRPPNNGWRFPWSTPPRLFARELNYEIEADLIKPLSLMEVKQSVLEGIERSELWYERLEMPEWKKTLEGYSTIEQIFETLKATQ